MNYSDLYNASLPNPTTEIHNDGELRKAYVCASAYLTFALYEKGVSTDRDLSAALVTAETHSLDTEQTPEEYLTKAIQELAYVERNVDDSHIQKDCERIRRSLQKVLE